MRDRYYDEIAEVGESREEVSHHGLKLTNSPTLSKFPLAHGVLAGRMWTSALRCNRRCLSCCRRASDESSRNAVGLIIGEEPLTPRNRAN